MRKLQESENTMPKLCQAIDRITNILNTANPLIRVLPFNCPSSNETKNVISDTFFLLYILTGLFQIVYTFYRPTAKISKSF